MDKSTPESGEPSFVAPASLAESEYIRQRLEPRPSDPLYLHLADLKRALESVLPPPGSRVLDYGCGGSPYRALFRTEEYLRADIPGVPGIDFGIGADSSLDAQDSDYDCILSTQVLEHVREVAGYLGECRRLLRPGGRLILTTHGVYPDHGCPCDFWRWTADGLSAQMERAGFKVDRVLKLTTGPRALIFLNELFHHRMIATERSRAAWMLRLSRLVYSRFSRRLLNQLCDRRFPEFRVAEPQAPGHEIYITLLAVCERA
jgi:SAM-dependent methyltransferase